MKTCPVCNAGAFDDAEVCYGCLHPFGSGEGPGALERQKACPPPGAQAGSPQRLDEVRRPAPEPSVLASEAVSVPARGADIVVRIELVGAPAADAAAPGEAACRLLRRATPIRPASEARPAEAQRGALAGQRAREAQGGRPRHAVAGPYAPEEEPMQAVGA